MWKIKNFGVLLLNFRERFDGMCLNISQRDPEYLKSAANSGMSSSPSPSDEFKQSDSKLIEN